MNSLRRNSAALARSAAFLSTLALVPALGVSAAFAAEQGPILVEFDAPVAAPQAQGPGTLPEVVEPVVVPRPASVSDTQYAAEKLAARTRRAPSGAVAAPIPAASDAARAAVGTSFEGLNRQTGANNGVAFIPPDTIVAKSPTRVIEAVNSAVRLFDTAGNVLDTRDLNSFFGAAVADGRLFDPKVYYDRNATNPRVYVVALQVSGRGNASLADNSSRMWVAVSRRPDPANLTNDWCRYIIDARSEIGTTDESWGDFPSIGAGRDSVSITLNNFRFSNDVFRFARIHVFNKDIASDNAASCPTIPRFVFQPSNTAANFGLFTIQPAQHYTSPSSGLFTTNPAYYMSTTFGSSDQYQIHRVRNVAGGSPTYTRVTLRSTSYDIPPDGNQPGTTMLIDSGDTRVLQVAGVGNTIVGTFTTVCQFTVGTTNESCTLTPRVTVGFSALGGLIASIVENTFAGFGDDIFVHHNSIATDEALRSAATWQFNGTGLAGFFHSSAAMFKLVNAGWQGVQTYASGNCAYLLERAGDFSGAQLDPILTDFWLAGEQAQTIGGSCQWGTRIVEVNP